MQCRRDLSFDFAQNPEALEGQVRMIGIGRRNPSRTEEPEPRNLRASAKD
jgi:hypothetical protein